MHWQLGDGNSMVVEGRDQVEVERRRRDVEEAAKGGSMQGYASAGRQQTRGFLGLVPIRQALPYRFWPVPAATGGA